MPIRMLRTSLPNQSAGYSQLGKFTKLVGPRRNYSGPEAALTVGFGWGR